MTEAYEALAREARRRAEVLEAQTRILVGTALCGKASGADQVAETLRNEMARRGIAGVVEDVGCLGLCYAEPLVDVSKPGGARILYSRVTPDRARRVVEGYLLSQDPLSDLALATWGPEPYKGIPSIESLDVWRLQKRVATRNCGLISPTDIYQYIAAGGYAALDRALSGVTPQQVIEEVTKSGLRGRGGAAFPTGTKWGFLARSPGPVKYILCNCEEGDPGAFNDKGILESDPHTVVEGITIAGYATGASYGHIFIRHGHEGPISRARQAIEAAREAGLLGRNILGSSFSFDIEVALTGESYVSGEETALMEAIEGKRAMPRFRPPFPAQVGLWGRPSNVNNVKTLAYIPEIVSRGGSWFASIGTEGSKGTVVLCITGSVARPGMYEVPLGMTLSQAISDLAGGVPEGRKLKLLQTGGPLGGVLDGEKADIPMDFEAMAKAGAILGSGGIIVGDDRLCAVDLTRVLVAFCQFESCGKCFPCRLGMTHLLEVMERIASGRGEPQDLELMNTVGQAMTMGSLCGHGQLGYNPVSSALRYFENDFRYHLEKKRCPTGSCDGPRFTPSRTRPTAYPGLLPASAPAYAPSPS